MDFVEAEGNSIDEAIERALELLGVARDKVEIDILANATRGILGMGGRKARVRATVRQALHIEGVTTSPDAEPPLPAPVEKEAPRDDAARRDPPVAVAPVDQKTMEQARRILQEIINLMGIEARAEVADLADGGRIAVTGDTSGRLIGRHGQTLDALEYLVNRIIAREEDHPSRIVVDSENYRLRRRQELEELARRFADQAKKRGRPVAMNPMNPRDRRIVHLVLKSDRAVVTSSTGDGYLRKLVIAPSGTRRDRSRPRRNPRPHDTTPASPPGTTADGGEQD